jgi:hypothetical protein
MLRENRVSAFVALPMAILLIGGCATPGRRAVKMDVGVPDPERLQQRVSELYEAECSSAWDTFEGLIWPVIARNDVMLNGVLETIRRRSSCLRSWQMRRIELLAGDDIPPPAGAAVLVRVDVSISGFCGTGCDLHPHLVDHYTDSWAYSGGEWWWMFRGIPEY